MRPLRPNQLDAAIWVENPRRSRCAICLDKRLGKCTICLRWLMHRLDDISFMLIVAPISAHAGWVDDLAADGFNPEFFILLDAPSRTAKLAQFQAALERGVKIFITNSESLFIPKALTEMRRRPLPTELALFKWDAVVWDEFTTLANPKNQVVQIALDHLTKARYKTILSGEYTPEGCHQVFIPSVFLNGNFMGHRNFWTWRAENFYQTGFDWKPKMELRIRKAFAEFAYILSRKDAGVVEPKTFEKRYCELPPAIRMEYDRIADDLRVELPEPIQCRTCNGIGWLPDPHTAVEHCCYRCGGDGTLAALDSNTQLLVMNWLHQIAGGFPKELPHLVSHHKLEILREFADEYKGQPLLVSFRYNHEMFSVHSQLQKDGHLTGLMYGDIQPPQRRALVQQMQSGAAGAPRILLAQTKVIRFGLNLSFIDTMFRYSLPFSYEDVSQSADRILDTEQETSKLYCDAICKDTIDEDVYAALANKQIVARLFMKRLRERVIGKIRMMV